MELRFTAGIDRNQFKSDIDAMRRDILGLNNTVKSETSKMDSSFKNLSLGIAGYFSVNAVQGFVRELINVRGEFQKTEIAFTTMLGNADQAKSLMNDMVTLAAKTPFSLQDVSSGAKQLLAFQVPANEVVDTLTRLGNIAAGLSVPLSRINLVYGQVKAKGKLMGDDLRQFTEAGIPMVAELAKKFGTTTSAITEMVSAGKIGFKDVQDVLFSMTNEGGMFFNLMEKQSKSLSGQIANLGDAWDQMLNKIGESNEGLIVDGIESLAYLVENYQNVIDIVAGLVTVYGAYRAALIVNAAMVNISAASEAGFTAAMMARLTITRLVDTATKALNATMLTNPTVLLIVGLSGLIYTYFKLRDTTTEAERTQKRFSESMEIVKNATEKLKNSTEEYIRIIKSEYSTQLQKFQAYQKLQNLYPSMLKNISMENFLKMETVEVNKLLAKGQEELGKVAFEKQIDKSAQRIQSLKNEIKILNSSLGKGKEGSEFTQLAVIDARSKALKAEENTYRKLQFIQRERNRDEEVSKMNAKERSAYFEKEIKSLTTQLYQQRQKNKNLKDSDILTIKLGNSFANLSLSSVLNQIDRMKAGLSEANAALQSQNKPKGERTKADWEKIKEDAESKLNSLTISDAKGKKGDLLRKQIADADKALDAWNPKEKVEKKSTETKKEVEKIFGENTIKGLQQRISKLQEIIETSVIGSDAYNKAFSDKEKFEKRLKEIQVQSFDEQISELKRQFSVRDKLLEQGYSKESVDSMFPDLKDKNFLQSMKDKAKALNDIVNAGKGDSQTKENLANINEQIRILEGRKSVLEEFTKNLDEEKEGKSSSQYIDFLNSQKTTGGSETDLAKNAEIQKRIEAEIEAQKEKFQQLLEEQRSYEEKSLALQKEYEDIKNSASYQNASDSDKGKIDDSFKDRFGALDAEMIKSTAEWQVAFGELEGMTNTSLQVILNRLLEFQAKTKGTLSLQDSAELQKAIDNVNNAANKNPFQKLTSNFSNYRTTLQASRKAQDDYNRVLKETPNDAKKVADAGAKMVEADKKAMEAKKKLVSQLQEGQDIFNAVGQGVMDLGDAFGGFDDATNDAIGNIMAIGNAAFDLGKSIASGDVAGMIKAGVQLIGSIGKALNGDQKKERQIKAWADQVKNLKVQYQELERAIDKALGDDKYKAQQNVIANLEKQKILLQQMIQKEKDKKKTDNGKIDDWKQQISDINAQIDDLKKSIVDDILQIDVKGLADKIGDALIEGFGRGEDALQSLNKTADEVFKDMVKNALKMQLEKNLQPVLSDMLKAMGYTTDSKGNPTGSFDGLTPEERDALKAKIIAATGDYQKAMEQYADLFGPDAANSPNGLKGDIKGITEKTAGALESQINAIRIYQVEALNISKRNQQIFLDALKYQAEIAYNTRPLFQIQKDIAELNSKVKKPLAGLG